MLSSLRQTVPFRTPGLISRDRVKRPRDRKTKNPEAAKLRGEFCTIDLIEQTYPEPSFGKPPSLTFIDIQQYIISISCADIYTRSFWKCKQNPKEM